MILDKIERFLNFGVLKPVLIPIISFDFIEHLMKNYGFTKLVEIHSPKKGHHGFKLMK